ncbi:PhnA-like protein [Rhodovastum atsumiense]|uniref:PhnA-like protein n=1 Tax=Rhodovastum atsumiense TaxID=504468 RepID=A0A5M6IMQ8_9PROT|nr:PhnA-like protein [Rhodovastum atsumiense]KAA5609522.1 PhnA-like protein [Rhodovastum atsumiense]CAH2604950.1 PhnA-like protein [Rhodovastum atsumiense]
MAVQHDPAYAGTYAQETIVPDDRRTFLLNRVSWGAILAGVVAALVVQILLNLLGIGIGAWSLDAANAADNPTASTFSITAGIWWTISGIIASFAGGIVAGRLCGAARANTARWHGLVTWCTTTFIVFWLLTSTVGAMLGGTLNALGNALGGAGRTAASAVTGITQNTDGNALENRVRQLVNPNETQNVQDSVLAYVRASVNGDQQAADTARDRAVDSLARAANISPDEARTRINQATQQYQQTLEQAKQRAAAAAEATRKGIATAGLFGFVALLLGAVASWFGGGIGTPLRETAVATDAAGRL